MKAQIIVPATRRKLKLARLSRLEGDASQAIEVAKQAWNLFIVIADKIKASGLWRLRAKRWKDYVFQTWGFKNTSRLSQYRKSLPYQKILEANNGAILESHIRKLAKHVPVEHPLMPQAFALGNSVADCLERAPTDAIYRRSLEILEQASVSNGVVTVGEKSFMVAEKSQAVAAVVETLGLVKMIALEGKPKTVIQVTGTRRKGSLYELEVTEGGALPEIIQFKIYLQE